jgi:hypothetical protein
VLDPDACAGTFGGLAVQRGDDGQPDYNSYMAFELGGEFAGETVGEVILRVRATDDPQAGGSNSGTVWEVESFTEGGIMSGEPSTVGTSLLGEYAPSFSSGETIDIQLLPSAIEADATFYLSIRGGSENSAVIYDDLTGPSPPQLIVRW